MLQQTIVKQQEQQSDDEDTQFNPSFIKVTLQNENAISQSQVIIIAQYGPASIYLSQQKSLKVGQVLQTTSNPIQLATIFQQEQLIFIIFEKDIRYYHYNEYDILAQLKENGLKEQLLILLMNISASSLEKYDSEECQIRCLCHNIDCPTKCLNEEAEGYFGELFYERIKTNKALSLVLVQTNYDLNREVIELFDCVRKVVPTLPKVHEEHQSLVQKIKQYQRTQTSDNSHI